MADENDNKAEEGKEEPKQEGATPAVPQPSQPTPPAQPFKEPKVLEAIVEPKQKPKEGPAAFSFTTPQAIQSKQAEPTKGDAAKTDLKNLTLAELDAQIARDEKAGKELGIEDYKDSAEMFVDAWESALVMICRAISKDTSDSAYSFPVATREKLIRQGIKVSRKRGWVMPIELLAGGTLLAATGTIVMKGFDKRKEYLASKKKEAPASSDKKEEKDPPRRGAGRPRK